jgi:hypothetical protein
MRASVTNGGVETSAMRVAFFDNYRALGRHSSRLDGDVNPDTLSTHVGGTT